MNEDQITLNFVAYTFLVLGIGTVAGWFLREIVYQSIKAATPKKKTRVKKAKVDQQKPDSIAEDGSIAV